MTDTDAGPLAPLSPDPVREALIWQLRLRDLFLWTALCAVDMALHRLMFITGELGSQAGGARVSASLMLYSVARGAALTIAVLWLARRLKHPPYTLWPGEWLLVVSGCRAMLVLPLAAIWQSPRAMGLAFFLTCWVYAIPALRAQAPTRWRLFYWLAAAVEVMRFLNPLLGLTSLGMLAAWNVGWESVVAVCLAALFAADYRSETRWPFSHWLGLAAWIWSHVLAIIMWILLGLGIH